MSSDSVGRDHWAKAELLDLVLSATQDGILDWNLIEDRATYNSRWLRSFGIAEGELGRYSPDLWKKFVHPDERAALDQLIRDHLEEGWPLAVTLRMRHADGEFHYVLCRGVADRDEFNQPRRLVVVFSNIDQQVRGEERQRALVAALPDTLFRVRADGTVVGLKRGNEQAGSPFAALREGATLQESMEDPKLVRRLELGLRSEGSEKEGRAFRVSSGRFHHEVRIVGSGDDESVCIVRDISEQLALEAQLLQSQKLGAIGQLAAGVAHEINTPLQFIGDNLYFARSAVADVLGLVTTFAELVPRDDEEGQRALEAAKEKADFDYLAEALPQGIERSLMGVERVTKIVRALKTFAHPEEDLVPTDLRELIESTVIVATNEWKYVAEIELDLADDVPLVPCVGSELNQVLLNLIVNASHAIADVVGHSGAKGKIGISTRVDGAYAELRVADTGTGIPEEVQPRVFEQFFTTKEVGKGTGQGLSLAYSCVVRRHRGTIHFESVAGEGTTFVIRIPLVRAPAAALPSMLPPVHVVISSTRSDDTLGD